MPEFKVKTVEHMGIMLILILEPSWESKLGAMERLVRIHIQKTVAQKLDQA